jgi:hypothetical protein
MNTKHEASRNFLWRTTARILDAMAYRNMSIERLTVILGWQTNKLASFLSGAVWDNVSDSDMLTLKELAQLMHALDMDVRLDLVRLPEPPAPTEPQETTE